MPKKAENAWVEIGEIHSIVAFLKNYKCFEAIKLLINSAGNILPNQKTLQWINL